MNLSKPQRRILQRIVREKLQAASYNIFKTPKQRKEVAQLKEILKELKRHLSDRATNRPRKRRDTLEDFSAAPTEGFANLDFRSKTR